VRVFSRGGHDWRAQLPAIVDAMRALLVTSAVLDGEGVICGPDGKSDFDCMRAVFGRYGTREAFLYAFDLLELDGRDLHGRAMRGSPGAAVRPLHDMLTVESTPDSRRSLDSREATAAASADINRKGE
jgi:hypothetical protein